MQSEHKQTRYSPSATVRPRQSGFSGKPHSSGKLPCAESVALEAEIAAEVAHGQLSSDELNSSNDN